VGVFGAVVPGASAPALPAPAPAAVPEAVVPLLLATLEVLEGSAAGERPAAPLPLASTLAG
jgi:hypothetical protein